MTRALMIVYAINADASFGHRDTAIAINVRLIKIVMEWSHELVDIHCWPMWDGLMCLFNSKTGRMQNIMTKLHC